MIKALRTFRVRPSLPEELAPLSALAANLRWAWHRPTRELFHWADPALWKEVGGNPVELLGRLSADRLEALTADAAFVARTNELRGDLDRYRSQPRWAQSLDVAPPRVAYFSPEFGLTHAMQTYSGGLGVLAGDHLKAASDLGLEVTGVGLLYRHGYFRQLLDANGWQLEQYPDLNPYNMPLRRLESGGGPATVSVQVGGHMVDCQVWKAEVGRVPLLLLDTDLPTNAEADRVITDKLYGGDTEHRLRQEIVLGIGGMRAVDLALELGEIEAYPEIFHSNEGHAGFLGLERVRRLVVDEGLDFDEAIESSRAAVLFTTHTPVAAGIDKFSRHLMERYFGDFAAECRVSMEELMAVGQVEGSDPATEFNMAVMGLRLSGAANGVSQLHGHVARGMFAPLWPGIAESESPIGSVTNGVHAATWIGREMTEVYDRHLAPDWARNPKAWSRLGAIGDDVLWRAKARAREQLVARLRDRVRRQHERRGESGGALRWTDEILDPEALTIGFARRFAEYKRGALLLRQPDRLRELLTSTERPVQLVFAGKAHPRDEIGKDIVRQLVHFSSDPELRARMVFVEDYDMEVARLLYRGCDLWLNNPRRPHEACGTSGEKAVLNGGLHCSTLDGWWDEMFDGENGFAIGGDREYHDLEQQDAADAQALFELLERTIVPMFFDRVEGPLPRRWLTRVRRSLETLAPRVLASRMVQEYALDHYMPLAERAGRLSEGGHRRARELASWRRHVQECWPEVTVDQLDGDSETAQIGDRRQVRVVVGLGTLTPADVRVELLHGPVRADGALAGPVVQPMSPDSSPGDAGRHSYTGGFTAAVSGEYGITARVVPHHDDLLSWADTGLVTWAEPEA